jgi:hypothetical protein
MCRLRSLHALTVTDAGAFHVMCATAQVAAAKPSPFLSSALTRSGPQPTTVFLSRFDICGLADLAPRQLRHRQPQAYGSAADSGMSSAGYANAKIPAVSHTDRAITREDGNGSVLHDTKDTRGHEEQRVPERSGWASVDSQSIVTQVGAMLDSLRAHLDSRLDRIDTRLASCDSRLLALEQTRL